MSETVQKPAITSPHYFAGPHGHIFEVLYKPKENAAPGNWALNVQAGALALDMDCRAAAIGDAGEFAREHWPKVGGLMIVDHRGHRA